MPKKNSDDYDDQEEPMDEEPMDDPFPTKPSEFISIGSGIKPESYSVRGPANSGFVDLSRLGSVGPVPLQPSGYPRYLSAQEVVVAGQLGAARAKEILAGIHDLRVAGIHDFTVDSAVNRRENELNAKISTLQSQLLAKDEELNVTRSSASADAKAQQQMIAERDNTVAELRQALAEKQKTEQLRHLLSRVHDSAKQRLIGDEEFKGRFSGRVDAFVMSIDLRRSTDLMLRARDGTKFAHFIIGLSDLLREIVIANLGIFDKFTGDGVLAFFPDFYSGRDFALRVVKTAAACHAAFQAHYDKYADAFHSMFEGVGLGIGVDFGKVEMVQIAEDLTVVGHPVVYACRLGGAPAGKTLLNQCAFEEVARRHGDHVELERTSLSIKNEDPIRAHAVRLLPSGRRLVPVPAEWESESAEKDDKATAEETDEAAKPKSKATKRPKKS